MTAAPDAPSPAELSGRPNDASTDQRADPALALAAAAARLRQEFDGAVDPTTIETFLQAAAERFAASSSATLDTAAMAERFARQQLQAVTTVAQRSPDDPPIVLFLCVHNAGRSQMALGWFNHYAAGRAVAWSGGSEPGTEVNAAAVAAMDEVGIDITGEFPKPWTEEIVRAADVVVTMGCGDACPFFPGTRYEDWALEDPAGQGVDAVRPIRDDIEQRVRSLLGELGLDLRPSPTSTTA